MTASNCISILDTYKWLPSYGENSVKCIYTEGNLIIDIFYDSKIADEEEKLTIIFKGTCFFSYGSYPGIVMNDIKYSELANMGGLNEYTVSTARDAWSAHFGGRSFRHFFMLFLSENKCLEVFAENFESMETK